MAGQGGQCASSTHTVPPGSQPLGCLARSALEQCEMVRSCDTSILVLVSKQEACYAHPKQVVRWYFLLAELSAGWVAAARRSPILRKRDSLALHVLLASGQTTSRVARLRRFVRAQRQYLAHLDRHYRSADLPGLLHHPMDQHSPACCSP